VAAPEVTIYAHLEGLEEVNAGFTSMAAAAGAMGAKYEEQGRRMDITNRRLMLTTAGLITNSVQLADIMGRMASGQMDLGRGALMLAMNFLQLGSQLVLLDTAYKGLITTKITNIALSAKEVAGDIAAAGAKAIHTAATWAQVLAEKALAVARAIAHALSGPWGWAILAGAAAAAGIGLGLAASIPTHHYEGVVPTTGPYILEKGQHVTYGSRTVTINIYGAGSPRETGDAVVDALRRAGAI